MTELASIIEGWSTQVSKNLNALAGTPLKPFAERFQDILTATSRQAGDIAPAHGNLETLRDTGTEPRHDPS